MSENPEQPAEETLQEIARFPSEEKAHEHALVILAMRQACWVAHTEEQDGFALLVHSSAAEAVERELAIYRSEQETETSAGGAEDFPRFTHPPGYAATGLWALVTLLAFRWQLHDPRISDLGASSSLGLVAEKEWWRPFTALFLHADGAHLAGNLVSGILLFPLVCRSAGAAVALPAILLAGALGNAFVSWFSYPEIFRSIGASTAVFAAVGILSALGVLDVARYHQRWSFRRHAAPLLAGIVVLGWFGGGGSPRTDVPGHFCGFLAGAVCGTVIGLLPYLRKTHDAVDIQPENS